VEPDPHHSSMVLGIDGGGSKTAAQIASIDTSGRLIVLGHGRGGPSNLRLAGKQRSLESLDKAVDEALAEAGLTGESLDYAVLALAGSVFEDVRDEVIAWALSRNLASKVDIIHDAEPVLASGVNHGCGVALIVGTGAVAVGINSKGESATTGGWGHWFGDKGSGFDLGCKALSAVAEAADDIGPSTMMSELVLNELQITDPRRILQKLSARGDVRREVAALSPIVFESAENLDPVALEIVKNAVPEAVKLVSAVSTQLNFSSPYPLMLAGGVACSNRIFHDELIASLGELDPAPDPIKIVDEPVRGCLKIAQSRLARDSRKASKGLSKN
jgi:N-acetylglucosamine kinase-like BadF-type ATPase